MQMEALAMTGAKLREAMDLLRSLKQKYPEDLDELLDHSPADVAAGGCSYATRAP